MSEERGEHILQEKYGTKKKALSFYNNQMLDFINRVMMDFIDEQEMMFISTADASGNCDSSFRAGEKGFVKVIDENRLIYPEYKGNGVMASLGNITENPHIGIMFIDFFDNQVGLHINGRAQIIENEQLATISSGNNYENRMIYEESNKSERWVLVDVDEAYIHCSKHVPLLKKVNSNVVGDKKKKNGDFFRTKNSKR